LAPPPFPTFSTPGGGIRTVCVPFICTISFAPRSFSVASHSNTVLAQGKVCQGARASSFMFRTSAIEGPHPHNNFDVSSCHGCYSAVAQAPPLFSQPPSASPPEAVCRARSCSGEPAGEPWQLLQAGIYVLDRQGGRYFWRKGTWVGGTDI